MNFANCNLAYCPLLGSIADYGGCCVWLQSDAGADRNASGPPESAETAEAAEEAH